MSTRVWTQNDAAPTDWPAVVGPDGVTYGRDMDAADNEDMPGYWVRQEFKHHPGGGVTFGPVCLEFSDIFDGYEVGAEVREATPDEAATWHETWLSGVSVGEETA